MIDFLKRTVSAADVAGKDLLEVGSYNVNGTPRSVIEPLKPKSYIGVDSQTGPCVDRVVGASELEKKFGKERFDVVISTEMLEHVKNWRSAVLGMKLVTKVGGLLVITTRSPGFPYHPYPEDHWRFTIDHFKAIFADMELLALESDIPTMPGVLMKARKTSQDMIPGAALEKIHLLPPK